VGILHTGPSAKRNRVADEASAEFDVRVNDMEDAIWTETAIREICELNLVHNPWTKQSSRSDLVGGIARPPMPMTQSRAELYCQTAGLAQLLQVPCDAMAVGGGSDANIASAVGLTVLDGVGPVGSGLHTSDEWLDLASVDDRCRLNALLMKRVLDGRIEVHNDTQTKVAHGATH
jgi:glutamate carboxypeptidase